MKFEMFEFSDVGEAAAFQQQWDVALVGEQCDERSKASIEFCSSHSEKQICLKYDVEEMELEVEGKKHQCHQIPELIKSLGVRRILLDGTTLGVPELGLLLKHLYSIKKTRSSILYVEPGKYTQKYNGNINGREFNLSSEILGYKGIPNLSSPLDIETPNSVIFFLGFEGYRLRLALEELNINPNESSLVFGVPSYKAGWEINAFANNIKSISENDLGGRVMFCGADNPAAVLVELDRLRAALGEDHRITIVPIGSKPHSIGALIFCSSDKNTNLIYDHPIKASNRSQSVGSIHLYKIN